MNSNFINFLDELESNSSLRTKFENSQSIQESFEVAKPYLKDITFDEFQMYLLVVARKLSTGLTKLDEAELEDIYGGFGLKDVIDYFGNNRRVAALALSSIIGIGSLGVGYNMLKKSPESIPTNSSPSHSHSSAQNAETKDKDNQQSLENKKETPPSKAKGGGGGGGGASTNHANPSQQKAKATSNAANPSQQKAQPASSPANSSQQKAQPVSNTTNQQKDQAQPTSNTANPSQQNEQPASSPTQADQQNGQPEVKPANSSQQKAQPASNTTNQQKDQTQATENMKALMPPANDPVYKSNKALMPPANDPVYESNKALMPPANDPVYESNKALMPPRTADDKIKGLVQAVNDIENKAQQKQEAQDKANAEKKEAQANENINAVDQGVNNPEDQAQAQKRQELQNKINLLRQRQAQIKQQINENNARYKNLQDELAALEQESQNTALELRLKMEQFNALRQTKATNTDEMNQQMKQLKADVYALNAKTAHISSDKATIVDTETKLRIATKDLNKNLIEIDRQINDLLAAL